LPVADPRIAFGPTDRAVNKMSDSRLLRCVGEILSLQHFAPRADRPKILDAVCAVGSFEGNLEGCRILEVPTNYFYALTREFLRGAALGVACRRAKFPSVW